MNGGRFASERDPNSRASYALNVRLTENYIGVDPTGRVAVPNGGAGIRVDGDVPFVHIGTYASGNVIASNVISGNRGHGIQLEGGYFDAVYNFIGTDRTGAEPIPNGGSGVFVGLRAEAHCEQNDVGFNRGAGFAIMNVSGTAAAIDNRIFNNGGPAIDIGADGATGNDPGDLDGKQNAPEIISATYNPATRLTTVRGRLDTLPPGDRGVHGYAVDFYASRVPEPGGRAEGETNRFYQTVAVGRGEWEYSFVEDFAGQLITATATGSSFHGFKTSNIIGQGFAYKTTSEMSNAVQVTTASCAPVPPTLVTPHHGVREPGPLVTFAWRAAPDALEYEIWLTPVGGKPYAIGTTTDTTLTVSLSPGEYEWFVKAGFADCFASLSDANRFTVAVRRPRPVR